jgi:ParB family chromosome partitioning protein
MTKRRALGKGLSALIPDGARLENGETRFFNCPVEAIEPNPYQPRQDFSEAEMAEMVQSVREKGILTPLLVSRSETGYQLIAGERRWRAAQRAGLTHVPVVVREVRDTESLELALIENIHRKDLNAIEEALAYKRLIEESGATQDAVAKILGKDRSTITNLLRLLKLPFQIQKHVIDGRLSVGHARVLAGLKNEGDRHRLSQMILEKGLSVRQAEAMGKKMTAPPRPNKMEGELDYYLKSLSDNLKRSLGTKVEIQKRGQRGKIVIHYYSDDELDRLLELLG